MRPSRSRPSGVETEVVDPRTLSPLDLETLSESVEKTGRLVVAHEAPRTGGAGGELVASLVERCFYALRSPPLRVAGSDVVYPPQLLEDVYLPDVGRIAAALRAVDGRLSDTWRSSSSCPTWARASTRPRCWPGRSRPAHQVPGVPAAVRGRVGQGGRRADRAGRRPRASRPCSPRATAHLGDVARGRSTTPRQRGRLRQTERSIVGIVGGAPPAPPIPAAASEAAAAPTRVLAAPFVRKLARERGIRPRGCRGSGPQGRVRIADLDASLASSALPCPNPSARRGNDVPFAGLRKSHRRSHGPRRGAHAPQVTSMDLFDVTELVDARVPCCARRRGRGRALTYLPFLVKACLRRSAPCPRPTPSSTNVSRPSCASATCHIGIATAVPGGLVVPVVRHAERRSLVDLAREIERLVAAARERQTPRRRPRRAAPSPSPASAASTAARCSPRRS